MRLIAINHFTAL